MDLNLTLCRLYKDKDIVTKESTRNIQYMEQRKK